MAPSWFKLLLVAAVIFLLFGRGQISDVMGDFAKGIKAFKRGMSDDPDEAEAPAKAIDDRPTERVEARSPAPREDLRS